MVWDAPEEIASGGSLGPLMSGLSLLWGGTVYESGQWELIAAGIAVRVTLKAAKIIAHEGLGGVVACTQLEPVWPRGVVCNKFEVKQTTEMHRPRTFRLFYIR
jgi:hypothetical protein